MKNAFITPVDPFMTLRAEIIHELYELGFRPCSSHDGWRCQHCGFGLPTELVEKLPVAAARRAHAHRSECRPNDH